MTRKTESHYDVIVAGGGAGGIGAALGAARTGAKTCLIEKYGFLGGAATHSQVLAYCGFFQQGLEPVKAVGGAADLVLDALRATGMDGAPYRSPTTGNWIIVLEPEGVKLALDRVLAAHGVDVLLHSRVAAVTRTGKAIESVVVAGMDGRERLTAEAFIDATGDANLSLVTGVSMQTGNEHGYLQAASAPIRVGGLAPDLKVDRAAIIKALAFYNTTGDYPVARTDGGIYTRMPGSGDLWWMIIDLPMHDLSSQTFSRAERIMRASAHDYVQVLRETVPGFENAYLVQTGPQIGVRESRHPKARLRITGEDLIKGRQRPDGVARAGWPAELHTELGKPEYHSVGGAGYAHVPLDALRSAEIDNLYFAGRTIGADDLAYGSIRVMGTAFATGEAAGVAAANPELDGAQVAEMITEMGGLV
ncbi:FAD-dependent oxidoreductase [Breoghania sp. L-A4]|uniref:FAD-dependent oxidoreductase n=1 Tax=Breoghania sp. L-A4 TaxID=2304600 RepID=UPI000E35FCA5|nr:FAD-dependent oxidoreductase [Breoghania sp. L-A4]AXS41610.1 FAD-dependent oxidoreductase [Breoghania sp. L-A4]